MKIDTMFPNRFLRADELRGPVTVTIQRVGQERMHKPGEGDVTGYVLYVVNGSRGLVLTKPLAKSIAAALGEDDTDNWPGKRVVLFPQAMTVAGKNIMAIRAREAAPIPQAADNGNGSKGV